jgi:hypothetical protein
MGGRRAPACPEDANASAADEAIDSAAADVVTAVGALGICPSSSLSVISDVCGTAAAARSIFVDASAAPDFFSVLIDSWMAWSLFLAHDDTSLPLPAIQPPPPPLASAVPLLFEVAAEARPDDTPDEVEACMINHYLDYHTIWPSSARVQSDSSQTCQRQPASWSHRFIILIVEAYVLPCVQVLYPCLQEGGSLSMSEIHAFKWPCTFPSDPLTSIRITKVVPSRNLSPSCPLFSLYSATICWYGEYGF